MNCVMYADHVALAQGYIILLGSVANSRDEKTRQKQAKTTKNKRQINNQI